MDFDGAERLLELLGELGIFSDIANAPADRRAALNSWHIPDEVVCGFLAAVPAPLQLEALAVCERPPVLHHWAHSDSSDHRLLVAANPWTDERTLRVLMDDEDPGVAAESFAALHERDVLSYDDTEPAPAPEDPAEPAA